MARNTKCTGFISQLEVRKRRPHRRSFNGMLRHSRRVVFLLALPAALLESPACAWGQKPKEQPPVLTAFSINGVDTVSAADLSVALVHTVVGARPSEFRVSRRADFAGARWEPYAVPLTLRDWYDPAGQTCDTNRPSHRVTLYLQVRATLGDEVRVVDGQRQIVPARVESNVLRATVCARTA
jgi:hypothetical protein